jgi:flagellar biosynthesis/type III secretory pathway M-ring protein FliF/YscJ
MIPRLGMMLAAGKTATPQQQIWNTLWQAGLLIVAALLLALVGYLVVRRNRARAGTDDGLPPTGFTLDALRRLHREGQLTDEEFARAKARLTAAVHGDTDASAAENPPPTEGPDADNPGGTP